MTLELVHVTIDSVEPERVAAFWSDALGRPVDPGGNGFFVSIGEQQPTPGQVAWTVLCDVEGNEFCVAEESSSGPSEDRLGGRL